MIARRNLSTPWLLTPAQVRTMHAMILHGCHKLAAREMGRSVKTVECHMQVIKARMGVRNQTMAALLFDRWLRSLEAAE